MPYIKLPDAIWRHNLSSAELMVYVALRRYTNCFGRCIVKHGTIAQLVGCSADTVARATHRLAEKGLLTIHTCKSKATGERIANGYTLELLSGGYTKVPASIFACKLPKSVFKVYLYLFKCRAKNGLQAVPSLSQMVSVLHMSKRTVVDAVKRLSGAFFVCKQQHRRRDNHLGHNRHTVLCPVLRLLVLRMALMSARRKGARAALSKKATRKMLEIMKTFKHIVPCCAPHFKGLEQKRRFYFLI